jgi:hypothetical protein
MNTYNYNTALEYFNSIEAYGKAIDIKGTEYHDIKFCCRIDSARNIVLEFHKTLPHMKDNLAYHVNKDKTKVIFGGRFKLDSRVKNFLYDLIAKHK